MLKEKTVLGGAVVAAFLASLCCILPLVFVLLGIGSLGIAAVFEPLRPYMMGGSVILLALAYYWVYFKSDKAESCAPGEECATKPANRASRLGLWFATLAVILFALTPYITAAIANRSTVTKEPVFVTSDEDCCLPNQKPKTAGKTDNNQPLPGNIKQVTFKVEGMSCATCEPAIRIALEKTPGVKRADVSYKRGNAIVDYDPKETSPEKLRDVINGTGYEVKD
jgi:mercuric ion transport protein